jgi:hypothetical protein
MPGARTENPSRRHNHHEIEGRVREDFTSGKKIVACAAFLASGEILTG